MLYSMTGFGRSVKEIEDYTVTVDIKSLNGKQFDLNCKIPILLKPYEIAIKNILQQELLRGSVEININVKQFGSGKPVQINSELATHYYNVLMQLQTTLNTQVQNPLAVVMAMPEVVAQPTDALAENVWAVYETIIKEAANNLTKQRATEGKMLETHLLELNNEIETHNASLDALDNARVEKQKARLEQLINENISSNQVDKNRLEQEIIYYIEKLDITEERTRLHHHCNYFKEIINDTKETAKGKKIGFILQEFGREINTLGSKANDSTIQKIVVLMKDALEKMKEQSLNVL